MNTRDAIAYMNEIWKYEPSDSAWGWKRVTKSGKGDCEDYGLSVIDLVEGGWWGLLKALMTKKFTMHWAYGGSIGNHWVFREKATGLYFDNISRALVTLEKLRADPRRKGQRIDKSPTNRLWLLVRLIPALIRGPV